MAIFIAQECYSFMTVAVLLHFYDKVFLFRSVVIGRLTACITAGLFLKYTPAFHRPVTGVLFGI